MLDFLERLKRARIVRVLAFYLGASWVILQVVDVLQDSLALPDWVAPVSVILLLIGFVIISATAMIQAGSPVSSPAGAPATDAGAGESAAPEPPLPSSQVTRLFTWKRALSGGAMAFLALFAVAGVTVLLPGGPSIGPEEAGADEAGVGLAVLPFSVNGPDMDVWREGMVDLLADNLDGTGGLRTIDPRTVMARWRGEVREDESPDLATMLEIARSTGAQYAVVGSAVALGDEVRLSTDIYDILSGEPMGSGAVEGGTADVMSMVDRLSVETASAVLATGGGDLPTLRHSTSLTTRSPDALRAYLEGEARYRQADFADAADAFRRAIAGDSTFALANLRLSRTLGWLRNIGDDEASIALERAMAFRDRLPPREAELLEIEQLLENQRFQAVAAAESAARNYPDDPEAWELLGEAYYHQGDQALVSPEQTLRPFMRAIELDPGFSPTYFHPIEIAAAFEDSALAYGFLAGMRAHATQDGRSGRYELFLPMALGSPDARATAMEGIPGEVEDRELSTGYFYGFRRTHSSFEGDLMMAREFARRGNTSMAALLRQSAELTRGRTDAALESTFEPSHTTSTALATLLAWTAWGEVPDDPRVRSLVMNGECDGDMSCFITAVLAAEMGEWPRHAGALTSYERFVTARESEAREEGDANQERRWIQERVWIDVAAAYGDLRRGTVTEVPEAFHIARTTQPWANWLRNARNQALRWWTAEILLSGGQAEQAVRYYDSLWGSPHGGWLTVRQVGLGDAARAMGNAADARAHYQAFLEAWDGADPEHPMMRRAAQGLEALGAG
jgi:Flp pilus assembly protein TadD